MVGEDAVGHIIFDHIIRYIGFASINKSGDDVVILVQLCNRVQLILIEKTLYQLAVDFLADPPVLAVNKVVDGYVSGKNDLSQVAKHVVVVGCGDTVFCLAQQLTGGCVGITGTAVSQQAVLCVVGGYQLAVYVGTVAVGVVAVADRGGSIPFNFE